MNPNAGAGAPADAQSQLVDAVECQGTAVKLRFATDATHAYAIQPIARTQPPPGGDFATSCMGRQFRIATTLPFAGTITTLPAPQ